MKFVRWLLGRIVLLIDFLTRPRPIRRDPTAQATIDAKTANMALYQFAACPFCVKVRRVKVIRRVRWSFKEELTSQGGKHKVPCLRIENEAGEITWLYESNDIISFLQTEFKLAS